MATSSLAAAVAVASPVPLTLDMTSAGPNIMLDPALPNLLLDKENLAKLEIAFPGHDFASLLNSSQEFFDFKAPVWPSPLPSIQNEIVSRLRKATKPDLPKTLKDMILLATEQLE